MHCMPSSCHSRVPELFLRLLLSASVKLWYADLEQSSSHSPICWKTVFILKKTSCLFNQRPTVMTSSSTTALYEHLTAKHPASLISEWWHRSVSVCHSEFRLVVVWCHESERICVFIWYISGENSVEDSREQMLTASVAAPLSSPA